MISLKNVVKSMNVGNFLRFVKANDNSVSSGVSAGHAGVAVSFL